MNILHIASLSNDPFTGVCVAAPEHIRQQGKYGDVALLNIKNCMIDNVDHQFVYHGDDWREDVSQEYRNPDIVVFHEVYHLEFVRIAKDLIQNKIPYVIIPHGCLVKSAQQKKWWKKKLANALFFRHFIHNSKAIQCLSENELSNTCFNVPKFIGTNGVNAPELHKTHFNDGKIKIVYIGRLEVIPKGLDLLLRAIKIVKEESEDLQQVDTIDLYGPDVKGRYAEVESIITDNDIKDIVTLHHELRGKEKQRRLLEADLFIQTSRHEGMPMGILEAMSYGVPCLITKGTSLGEIVKRYDAGWVADNSAESISATIRKAINERILFAEKSSNGRRLIEDCFSWEIIAQNAIYKYERIIHK